VGNLTERSAGQAKQETRYDYAAAVAMRYQRSSREQEGWTLDEFCAASLRRTDASLYGRGLAGGWHRREHGVPLVAPGYDRRWLELHSPHSHVWWARPGWGG
jgi:hypothetical protein